LTINVVFVKQRYKFLCYFTSEIWPKQAWKFFEEKIFNDRFQEPFMGRMVVMMGI
jgi:hypothetical protein